MTMDEMRQEIEQRMGETLPSVGCEVVLALVPARNLEIAERLEPALAPTWEVQTEFHRTTDDGHDLYFHRVLTHNDRVPAPELLELGERFEEIDKQLKIEQVREQSPDVYEETIESLGRERVRGRAVHGLALEGRAGGRDGVPPPRHGDEQRQQRAGGPRPPQRVGCRHGPGERHRGLPERGAMSGALPSSQQRLLAELEEADAPEHMIERARTLTYHDFQSPHPLPKMLLVEDAKEAGLDNIARRAKEGVYDP